jgi:hypothetical protein
MLERWLTVATVVAIIHEPRAGQVSLLHFLQRHNTVMNNKPVSVDALVTKAQSLVDVFEFDAAMKFCKRAAKQAPKDARVMELMGVIAMETGNDDRALAVSPSPSL